MTEAHSGIPTSTAKCACWGRPGGGTLGSASWDPPSLAAHACRRQSHHRRHSRRYDRNMGRHSHDSSKDTRLRCPGRPSPRPPLPVGLARLCPDSTGGHGQRRLPAPLPTGVASAVVIHTLVSGLTHDVSMSRCDSRAAFLLSHAGPGRWLAAHDHRGPAERAEGRRRRRRS